VTHLAADGHAGCEQSHRRPRAGQEREEQAQACLAPTRRGLRPAAQQHDLADGRAHHTEQESVDDEGDAQGAEGGGVGPAGDEHEQQQLRAAGEHLVDKRPGRPAGETADAAGNGGAGPPHGNGRRGRG
jgi:hypothetical protein